MEQVTFDGFEQAMHDFKVKHVYERMRADEEKMNV